MPTSLTLSAEARGLTKAAKHAEEAGNIEHYNIPIGDRIGTQVKDSFVQRSNIGAGAMKKCPHCGAALPKYASFCGECGGKLG